MLDHISFDAILAAASAAGEATRLRLLALLAEAELTVSELVTILGQSQPRISRHLKLLVEAGLAERHREGSWVFFRLAQRGPSADFARGRKPCRRPVAPRRGPASAGESGGALFRGPSRELG